MSDHPIAAGKSGFGMVDVETQLDDLLIAVAAPLEELDINPLVFCQGRWTVLDAKLILT